ncbi:MAG: two-component regulator propeller domain-containing protein [Mucilaginibacter sp.]
MAPAVKKYYTRWFTVIFLTLFSPALFAQKYNFQHYDIDKGLLQSQVTSITKDNLNQIWLSNLGGINCFDGKQFTSFTVGSGIKNYFNFAIATDNNGRVWCGNSGGLTCFESKGLINYPFTGKNTLRPVRRIVCDRHDNIWALSNQTLFKIVGQKLVEQQITGGNEVITDIEKDERGSLYAAVQNKGIYRLRYNKWQPFAPLSAFKNVGHIIQFAVVPHHAGQVYMITQNKLFFLKDSVTSAVDAPLIGKINPRLVCLAIDHNLDLWLGTDKGAFLLSNHTLKHFDDTNGFTNTRVFSIFVDYENHIWFGTDGAGLYKYQLDNYQMYDRSQGLTSDLAMAMVKNRRGEIYIATYGGGLMGCKNGKIIEIKNLPSGFKDARVNCLYADTNDDLWIGTDDLGLWKKTKTGMIKISDKLSCTSITGSKDHTIWLTTNFGCFYIQNNKTIPVYGLDYQCTSLLSIGTDSLYAGTFDGLVLVKDKKIDETKRVLRGTSINCMQKYQRSILIGTTDRGLFVLDTRTGKLRNMDIKNLAGPNTISSMLIVGNQLWLGTSRGINRYMIEGNDTPILKKLIAPADIYECNLNAVLLTDHKVWIGTTHGIIIFDNNIKKQPPLSLHLAIQKVSVNNPDVKFNSVYKNGYKIPEKLELSSDESRLAIKFQAIEFGDNRDIFYRYKLEGLDKDFSWPVQNNAVEYPQLPPGSYTFKVKAIVDGMISDTVSYTFTIVPTIYQTAEFKFIVLLFLLSIVFGIYLYKIYSHRKKLNYINQLKHHEQDLVRRQTAEDFHDDLGNKLTRINMLAELLARNFARHSETESKLVEQIQRSASEMYAGTKDILWALNPDNDNLAEVLDVIKGFAENLFMNIDVKLSFNIPADEVKLKQMTLPLGHSRNIILIFKELFTNILKHSKANIVTFAVYITPDGCVEFDVTDNGHGFDPSCNSDGNGIKNMRNRAKKLNASLTTTSNNNTGTTSVLLLPIP